MRLPSRFKNAIKLLSEQQKEEIIFKVSRLFPDAYEYIEYEFTDTYDLYIKCQKDIEAFMNFSPQRRYIQSDIADAINQSIKRVVVFYKETKSVRLEIAMLVHVLKIAFRDYSNHLGTVHTAFDTKAAITTKKIMGMVKKYRPEATWQDYAVDLDDFIGVLKASSPHVKAVISLPESFLDENF